LKKQMSTLYQIDCFDESTRYWLALPQPCRVEIEKLLSQLFIESIKGQWVQHRKEDSDAIEN
jgi:hypothetical protein